MLKKIKYYYKKFKEQINYIIFGVFTTLVNYLVYLGLTRLLNTEVIPATIIAWVLAVLFAYITNKKFVFASNSFNFAQVTKEIASFFSLRIVSGIFEVVCMYIFVSVLQFNDIIIKLIVNIAVIILNYIFSKLIVFRKSDGKQ